MATTSQPSGSVPRLARANPPWLRRPCSGEGLLAYIAQESHNPAGTTARSTICRSGDSVQHYFKHLRGNIANSPSALAFCFLVVICPPASVALKKPKQPTRRYDGCPVLLGQLREDTKMCRCRDQTKTEMRKPYHCSILPAAYLRRRYRSIKLASCGNASASDRAPTSPTLAPDHLLCTICIDCFNILQTVL